MKSPAGSGGAPVSGDKRNLDSRVIATDDTSSIRSWSNISIVELRRVWWRQAVLDHRLPAERGIILIDGDAP